MKRGSFNFGFNHSFQRFIIMNREQILASIATNLTGQGNQVDIGGALADILNEIVNRAVPMEVTDITALTGDQLDVLEPGSVVIKKTGTASHLYTVTYKDAANGGLCLTYVDASTVETVSYDNTDDGWVYNSTDVTHISE